MTNTNDFRQYSYRYDTANLISSFNYTRGSHAPKVRPEYEEPERKLRVKETKGIKSQPQLLHEQRVSRKKAIQISVAAVVFLAMIGLVLNSFVFKNQLTREIAKQEAAIANAQSEHISLESQLNIMYSVSMIDKYAVGKLGMSKVRQGQIQYMDVDSYKAAAAKNKNKKKNGKKLSPAAAAMAAAKQKPAEADEKKAESENEDGAQEAAEETEASEEAQAEEYSDDNGYSEENEDSSVINE